MLLLNLVFLVQKIKSSIRLKISVFDVLVIDLLLMGLLALSVQQILILTQQLKNAKNVQEEGI